MKVLIVTSEWPLSPTSINGIQIFRQVEMLCKQGVDVDIFHFRGKKNPFRYLRAIYEFNRIDLSSYDVIHAQHGQSGIVALSQNKKPVVVTFRGSDLNGLWNCRGKLTLQGLILRIVSQYVAEKATKVVLVAEQMKNHIKRRDYHIISSGIDFEKFKPLDKASACKRLGLSGNRNTILFVGDPDRAEKRFWLAHSAVEIVKETKPVDLIVACGMNNDLMPFYYNACDVMVCTSLSEGSPVAIREALACNMPIVSVDVGDVRKRIEKISGCFIVNNTPEDIARALIEALNVGGRVQSRDSVALYSEDIQVKQLIRLYESCL